MRGSASRHSLRSQSLQQIVVGTLLDHVVVQFAVGNEPRRLARGGRRVDHVIAGDQAGRRLDRVQIGFGGADDRQMSPIAGTSRASTS